MRKQQFVEVVVLQEPTPNGYRGDDAAGSSPSIERSIFRAEALQRYRENQDKVVLPRLVSPRVFAALWIVALLLLLVGSVIAFWPLIAQIV